LRYSFVVLLISATATVHDQPTDRLFELRTCCRQLYTSFIHRNR